MTISIEINAVADIAGLGPRWRALEARARGSFFQSWSWLGCLAVERFARPMLLAVTEGGRDVALALFNRGASRLAPGTLWLGESGIAAFDALYVEHNGVLVERGRQDLLGPVLQALRPSGWGRLVLSGVDDAHLAAARGVGGVLRVLKTQPSPFVELGAPFLEGLSAGTRYQLRRSWRSYGRHGAVRVEAAGGVGEAQAMLDELGRLHQVTWTGRGRPGAFANPVFRRFHRALIEQALPRGEVELLRVVAGEVVIGYLYNFCYNGDVLAYQSGFDYAAAGPHERPGLTCHHMAIERAAALGMRRYDFLAGEDRYKASLASGAVALHWLDLVARWSPRGVVAQVRGMRSNGHS